MAEVTVDVKIKVDSSELDEAISKAKELQNLLRGDSDREKKYVPIVHG